MHSHDARTSGGTPDLGPSILRRSAAGRLALVAGPIALIWIMAFASLVLWR